MEKNIYLTDHLTVDLKGVPGGPQPNGRWLGMEPNRPYGSVYNIKLNGYMFHPHTSLKH